MVSAIFSGDGEGAQNSPKAYDGVRCGVIPAIMLGLAELSDAHGRQADVATACKAKNGAVHDDKRKSIACRKPQTCIADEA